MPIILWFSTRINLLSYGFRHFHVRNSNHEAGQQLTLLMEGKPNCCLVLHVHSRFNPEKTWSLSTKQFACKKWWYAVEKALTWGPWELLWIEFPYGLVADSSILGSIGRLAKWIVDSLWEKVNHTVIVMGVKILQLLSSFTSTCSCIKLNTN